MGEGLKYCRKCGRQTTTEDLSSAQSSEAQPIETIVFGGSQVEGFSSTALSDSQDLKTRTMPAVEPPPSAPTVELPQARPVDTGAIEPARRSQEFAPVADATGPIPHSTGPVRARSNNRMLLPLGILLGLVVIAAGVMLALHFSKGSSEVATGSEETAAESGAPPAVSNANDSEAVAEGLSLDLENSNESKSDNSNRPKRANENRAGGKAGDEDGKDAGSSEDANTTAAATPEPDKPPAEPPKASEPPPKEEPRPTAEELKKSGLEALGKNRFAEAASRFRAALRLRPSDDDLHYLIAMAYERQGLLEEALAEYRACNSGTYAPLAVQHVKRLAKRLEKK